RGEQVDDRLGDVGQSVPGSLHAEMSRRSPKRLLADRPDSVADLVQEAALVLEDLRKDQRRQLLTLPGVQRVVMRPVSVADVLQRDRGRDALPGGAEILLRLSDERGPTLLGNRLPLCTILDGGIRMPLSGRDQS